MVRLTHWLVTIAFFALLVSGVEILISHPRLYWGETGNVNMQPIINFHIPSSRGMVPTGYGYVLPDENGWSRYLHFESAWLLVLTGLLYFSDGLFFGHFRKNLFPTGLSMSTLADAIGRSLHLSRPTPDEAWSYNLVQRLTYLFVVFILFPMVIWTGLAMSPAVASVVPAAVSVLGGQQSARTLHFFVSAFLVLFVLVHVIMVIRAGFLSRTGAMITGRAREEVKGA